MEVVKVSIVVGNDARIITPDTGIDAVDARRPGVTCVRRIITVGTICRCHHTTNVGRVNADAWFGAAGWRN